MKIYLEVYGCTANKADASLIKGILKENKYEIVKNLSDADFAVILTCTVIDTTEQRMLSRIKKLKASGKKIIIAGCMASIQKEKIKKILPDARFLPPQYSHHIVDIIKNKNISFEEKNKTCFSKYYDEIIAPIAIAEGCMFSCSYCITTHARGKLRSFPINEIKKDVYNAVNSGCREIQLTAQDTSSFGLDKKTNLGKLLENVVEINKDFRIRIGMMNPFTCLKNLDDIIKGFNSSKIYKFVHLPVQSGDNEILKKMNRKYTVEEFEKIVSIFREKYPDITIATDIIVGFPGETDKQFQTTVDLVKKLKPDVTNITRFSARPNTFAKNFNGRITTDTAKQRSRILTEICDNISFEQNKKHIGKKYKVLVTELGKNNTFVTRSENYKPVVLKEKVEIGFFKEVQIMDAAPTYLLASLI
jgi:threonylcarbamoyladenosine tRNA methylthiotransferase CDKAL1